jgi:hypothetical protein
MSDFENLKKATDIDPNVWYHLTEENVDDYDGDFRSMLQTFKEESGDDGFRVFGVGDRKTYWQFVRSRQSRDIVSKFSNQAPSNP